MKHITTHRRWINHNFIFYTLCRCKHFVHYNDFEFTSLGKVSFASCQNLTLFSYCYQQPGSTIDAAHLQTYIHTQAYVHCLLIPPVKCTTYVVQRWRMENQFKLVMLSLWHLQKMEIAGMNESLCWEWVEHYQSLIAQAKNLKKTYNVKIQLKLLSKYTKIRRAYCIENPCQDSERILDRIRREFLTGFGENP